VGITAISAQSDSSQPRRPSRIPAAPAAPSQRATLNQRNRKRSRLASLRPPWRSGVLCPGSDRDPQLGYDVLDQLILQPSFFGPLHHGGYQ